MEVTILVIQGMNHLISLKIEKKNKNRKTQRHILCPCGKKPINEGKIENNAPNSESE